MTRFLGLFEFDGAPFMGWQRQKHGASVQGAIEAALLKITGESVTVQGCGRTDTGVHALAMPAHFDVAQEKFDANRVREALNAVLRPDPIAALEIFEVPGDFNARFDCLRRHYRYQIWNRRPDLAVGLGRWWHVKGALDIDAMREAAGLLIGKHDFTSFRASECQAASPLKTLDHLEVSQLDDEQLVVTALAKSFLHHQVRNMVGTLVDIGLGRWEPQDISQMLAAKDRHAAGRTAPAEGLFFVKADYAQQFSSVYGGG